MKKTTLRLSYSIFIGLFIVVGIVSCGKKDPAKAEITVVDEKEDRVAEATVNIICIPVEKQECVIDTTGETNSSGQVEFEFDHPAIYGSDDVGFAVLKVEASKNYDSTYAVIVRDAFGNPLVNAAGGDSIEDVDSFYTKYGDMFIELQVDEVTKETVTIIYEN